MLVLVVEVSWPAAQDPVEGWGCATTLDMTQHGDPGVLLQPVHHHLQAHKTSPDKNLIHIIANKFLLYYAVRMNQ